jgi:hypothetical protein
MPDPQSDYWFPAKRFGFGWGLPCRWQGWLTMVLYLGVVVGASVLFPDGHHALAHVSVFVVATALLVLVCVLKGEPPRGR